MVVDIIKLTILAGYRMIQEKSLVMFNEVIARFD